tara:strand:+ start:78 stop:215 length:138 start_codon:yes stop_codon:yes gene_type:complete
MWGKMSLDFTFQKPVSRPDSVSPGTGSPVFFSLQRTNVFDKFERD